MGNMNLSKKGLTLLIALTQISIFSSIFCSMAYASDYPNKPITLLVGFAPGGGTDLGARTLAAYFSKKWGQQIVVVNKPGGNTIPANVELYKSKPDGYTLLADTNASSSIQASTSKNLPYKVEDRTFISNALLHPLVYLCSSTKPWKTLKDVADSVKKQSTGFKWGAMEISSTTTFSAIQFFDQLGVDISKTKKIDCKSGPEVLMSTANGEIDLSNYGIGPALPLIDAGKLHPLALSSPRRIERLPNLPTVKEAGFPGLNIIQFIGISGPPNIPREVIDKWSRGMKEASDDTEFNATVEKIGNIMYYLPPDAFKERVIEEIKIYRGLAQKIGVK
jgi:tripartite-type tricarboxylate transporter receptor subunit TctC